MKTTLTETSTADGFLTEREEFEAVIQADIRFVALQDNIASLSRHVLTVEGKRFYDYCVEERGKIRLPGLRRGLRWILD